MPDNAGYLQAAYIAGAVIFLAYALSIPWRRRALRARRAPEQPGSAAPDVESARTGR
jgi:hypothetical protein